MGAADGPPTETLTIGSHDLKAFPIELSHRILPVVSLQTCCAFNRPYCHRSKGLKNAYILCDARQSNRRFRDRSR